MTLLYAERLLFVLFSSWQENHVRCMALRVHCDIYFAEGLIQHTLLKELETNF